MAASRSVSTTTARACAATSAAVVKAILLDRRRAAAPTAYEPASSRSRCCASRSSGARTARAPRAAATPVAESEHVRSARAPLQSPVRVQFLQPVLCAARRDPRCGPRRARARDRDRVSEHRGSRTCFYTLFFAQLDARPGLPDDDDRHRHRRRGGALRRTPTRWSNRVADKLLGGTMSHDACARGAEPRRALCRRPTARTARREAIYSVVTSPEFAVQR